MIENTLKELGFSDKKNALYLAILQTGSASAAELAAVAGIKRTTAYDILDELYKENLVTVTFSGKKRLFTAEHPDHVKLLIENKLQAVKKSMPLLYELFNNNIGERPKIRFYEGVSGIKKVHNELLNIKSKEYFYIGSISSMINTLGKEHLDNFVKQRIRKGIWANAIRARNQEVNSSLLDAGKQNLRRVRYLPTLPSENLSNLLLFDNKVGVCSSTGENYAIIIESQDLHKTLKVIWDCLWNYASEKA
jgi:HTH-type transcriptional regulator, sugar sensing transcriptional regulator